MANEFLIVPVEAILTAREDAFFTLVLSKVFRLLLSLFFLSSNLSVSHSESELESFKTEGDDCTISLEGIKVEFLLLNFGNDCLLSNPDFI